MAHSAAAEPLADEVFLPLIREVPASEKLQLRAKKVQLCCHCYDFHQKHKDIRQKAQKRETLLELVQFSDRHRNFADALTRETIDMIGINLFRPLPRHPDHPTDTDENTAVLDKAWPHLQLLYELLLRFIISAGAELGEFVTKSFTTSLLELFHSLDPRERDYLKTIFHRIYSKIVPMRPFLRQSIGHFLCSFKVSPCRNRTEGVAELLEIAGSVVSGFVVPLRQEHLVFLDKVILPLHKLASVGRYMQQLSFCCIQYLEKDVSLAEPVIRSLLNWWPVANHHKELLFLNELEEILELTRPAEFEKVMVPLVRQVCRCACSPHFQVAQHQLCTWNNEYFVSLFAQKRHVLLPMVFAPLYHNYDTHWNRDIRNVTFNVLHLLMEMDSNLFDACALQLQSGS